MDPNQETEVIASGVSSQLAAGAYLELLTGARSGEVFAVESAEVVIGRGDTCTIQLAESSISRFHCKIVAQADGEYVLQDLASTNGTCLGGKPLQQPTVLHDGDLLRLGPTLTFRFGRPVGDRLCLYLFGPGRVVLGSTPIQHWKSQQVRNLLFYLALHWESERSPETIVADLWPQDEMGSVRNLLNPTVSYLRKALAGDQEFLDRSSQGLRLRPQAAVWIDCKEFLELGRTAQSLQVLAPERAAQTYHRQVDLYTGPLLDGQPLEWCLQAQYNFEAQWVEALRFLVHHCRQQPQRCLDYAQQWLKLGGPTTEAGEVLLRSLLELNRAAEVLVHFEGLARQLDKQGMEVSTEMLRLQQTAKLKL